MTPQERAFTPAGNGCREYPDVFHEYRFSAKKRGDRGFGTAYLKIERQDDGLGKFRKASRVSAGVLQFIFFLCTVDDENDLPDPELPGEGRRFPGDGDRVIGMICHDHRTGEPFGNGPPEMFEPGRGVS